jgi:putative PIN family toxin of toxin-antitoxin system
MSKPRFVFDTNTFISAVLLDGSINSKTIDKALKIGEIVVSETTFAEFTQVLFREKFDKYLINERRLQAISKLERDTKLHNVEISFSACRDPKDDKFLELAVDCKATCIVTGGKDLLVLHPFRNIPVLTVSEFLNKEF